MCNDEGPATKHCGNEILRWSEGRGHEKLRQYQMMAYKDQWQGMSALDRHGHGLHFDDTERQKASDRKAVPAKVRF